jgi:hypothetical protein
MPGAAPVESISEPDVRAATEAIGRARQEATTRVPVAADGTADCDHWQRVLEANAAAVLLALEHVSLPSDFAVRYRVFEPDGSELRVRPFVARATTDVAVVRAALDWHPPPDSGSASERLRANRNVELLYRHFTFERSPVGIFHYWLAMQEIWASTRWVHTQVIANSRHFAEIVAGPEWRLEHPLETHHPLVVREGDRAVLALLLYSPLQRHSIALQQISIEPDNRIAFAEPITVAMGPRGYLG